MQSPTQKKIEEGYVKFCLSKPDPRYAAKGFSKTVREAVEKELRKREPKKTPTQYKKTDAVVASGPIVIIKHPKPKPEVKK